MEDIKNKNLWIWVIVILIIIFGFYFFKQTPAPVDNGQAITPTEDTSIGSINAGASAASISYANALIKYKNARIQLDENCQANAQSQKMTFKNNAYLMIDNRAPVARTIHLGIVFPIKAYGFKIIKLYSPTLPVTWRLDCDSNQNVSTVSIQK